MSDNVITAVVSTYDNRTVSVVVTGADLIEDARRLRNSDVRAMCAEVGPAETARRLGMKLSTVKAIRGAK